MWKRVSLFASISKFLLSLREELVGEEKGVVLCRRKGIF